MKTKGEWEKGQCSIYRNILLNNNLSLCMANTIIHQFNAYTFFMYKIQISLKSAMYSDPGNQSQFV